MSDVAITPVALTMNTMSDDLDDASGTAISNTANTFVIATSASGVAVRDMQGTRLLLKFVADGSGDTVVIKAGDRPPSQRADLGDLSLVLAASDVRYIAVEAGRFLQDDGSIHATCSDTGTKASAFLLPRGLGGDAA